MKVKEVKTIKEEKPDGFELVVGAYADPNDSNRTAVVFGSQNTKELLLAASRINRIIAKTINIPYPAFLKMLDASAKLDEKYGNMNLSDEQLKKIAGKELRGYDLKGD